MNNKKRTLDITIRTNHVRKCKYVIGTTKKTNGRNDWFTFAWVWVSIVGALSETDDNIHMKMCFELEWNALESPTLNDQTETLWLFKNLVETIGYDMKNLIDDNICTRINSALPTRVKILRKD